MFFPLKTCYYCSTCTAKIWGYLEAFSLLKKLICVRKETKIPAVR